MLTPQSQTTLTAQAQWLILHPFVRASIEGHADSRQTRDYALALGERRAAAVRNYLIASGVPPEQLQIVSWGKERPETAAVHDATWLQNSRVVTVLKQLRILGGVTLVRAEPGARLALRLGDFARGHLDRDLGPALLATRAAR